MKKLYRTTTTTWTTKNC